MICKTIVQLLTNLAADRREFIKISQAVGMGFLIMGAIGYFIKLSKWKLFLPSQLDCFALSALSSPVA